MLYVTDGISKNVPPYKDYCLICHNNKKKAYQIWREPGSSLSKWKLYHISKKVKDFLNYRKTQWRKNWLVRRKHLTIPHN